MKDLENKESEEKLKLSITKGNFEEALLIIKNMNFEKVKDILYIWSYDTGSLWPYSFIHYLLRLDDRAEYHYAASEMLSMTLMHLPDAYNIALYHANKAMELDPQNILYKEYMLLFYELPEQLLSKKQAYNLAKAILLVDENNEVATKVLNELVE